MVEARHIITILHITPDTLHPGDASNYSQLHCDGSPVKVEMAKTWTGCPMILQFNKQNIEMNIPYNI